MWRKGAAIISLLIMAGIWLFVGVYEDREWGECYSFIKYRPTIKVFFYSPLGEADRSEIPGREGYLTAEQQPEEDAYVEFVEINRIRK